MRRTPIVTHGNPDTRDNNPSFPSLSIMKSMSFITRITFVMLFCIMALPVHAQQTIFLEDFESGTAAETWRPYLEGEEKVAAVNPSFAAEPLAGSGSFIGHLQDIDGSYTGAAIALAGNSDATDYSIEGDVYCYVNPFTGSAYTGLVVYADEVSGTYVKLATDFDADRRLRLYNNRLNTSTFEYTFHHAFEAGDVPGGIPASDGWRHMKVDVRTINADTTAYWCYFDGELLAGRPIYDTGSDRVGRGRFGLFSFQQSGEGIPGYYDNIVVRGLVPASSVDDMARGMTDNTFLWNHPNPFERETRLACSLNQGGFVTLAIHDLLGRPIKTILAEYRQAGEHIAIWKGDDELGNNAPTGTHVCRLSDGNSVCSRMIMLAR